MATSYEEAIAQLFQASQERFVPERKRLSLELKAAGDKPGAARFGRLNRPPVSAWVVNQLWWNAQEAFEQLFATAARQRAGDRAAASEHRQQLAELRARCAELLQAAGHAASESTLRRVTMTLAALAVAGNFEPDAPGALTGDRDPPGFETLALGGALESLSTDAQESEPKGAGVKRAPRHEVREPPDEKPKPSAREASLEEAQREEAQREEAQREEAQREEAQREEAQREEAQREEAQREEAQRRKEEAEEQERRVEAQRARRQAERDRLHAALQSARAELDARERAAAARREELATAEKALERALASAEQAAARLKAFDAEA